MVYPLLVSMGWQAEYYNILCPRQLNRCQLIMWTMSIQAEQVEADLLLLTGGNNHWISVWTTLPQVKLLYWPRFSTTHNPAHLSGSLPHKIHNHLTVFCLDPWNVIGQPSVLNFSRNTLVWLVSLTSLSCLQKLSYKPLLQKTLLLGFSHVVYTHSIIMLFNFLMMVTLDPVLQIRETHGDYFVTSTLNLSTSTFISK